MHREEARIVVPRKSYQTGNEPIQVRLLIVVHRLLLGYFAQEVKLCNWQAARIVVPRGATKDRALFYFRISNMLSLSDTLYIVYSPS